MGTVCTGQDLNEWLKATGLICCDRNVRRIVLDIKPGEPVKVYIEEHGGMELLKVEPPDLNGAVVQWSRMEKDDDGEH